MIFFRYRGAGARLNSCDGKFHQRFCLISWNYNIWFIIYKAPRARATLTIKGAKRAVMSLYTTYHTSQHLLIGPLMPIKLIDIAIYPTIIVWHQLCILLPFGLPVLFTFTSLIVHIIVFIAVALVHTNRKVGGSIPCSSCECSPFIIYNIIIINNK